MGRIKIHFGISTPNLSKFMVRDFFQIRYLFIALYRSLLFQSPSEASWLQQKPTSPFFHHQSEVQNKLREGILVYINWSTYYPVIFAHWTLNSLTWIFQLQVILREVRSSLGFIKKQLCSDVKRLSSLKRWENLCFLLLTLNHVRTLVCRVWAGQSHQSSHSSAVQLKDWLVRHMRPPKCERQKLGYASRFCGTRGMHS